MEKDLQRWALTVYINFKSCSDREKHVERNSQVAVDSTTCVLSKKHYLKLPLVLIKHLCIFNHDLEQHPTSFALLTGLDILVNALTTD